MFLLFYFPPNYQQPSPVIWKSATNGHANLALQQQGRGQQHHVAKGQPAPRIPGLTVLIFGGLVLGNINGFLHSLNGNIVVEPWKVSSPYRNLGHSPLTLPNGMIVFWICWKPAAFRVWYKRRQKYRVLESSKQDSPLLYRHLVKAITANCGEPGSRHLIPMDLQRRWLWHRALQSGHEDRPAVGGNQTGFRYRSEAARARRKEQTRARRAQSRRDYRAWKILQGESFGWAGQRVLAPPPLLPANSTLKRSNKSRIPTQPQYTASRKAWFRTYVQRDHHSGNIPKQPRLHTPIKVATWNVEGLYELTKYEQIMEYMIRNHVAIVALQETKATQTHSFIKKGFEFFFSADSGSKHHGVGFVVAPQMRHLVVNFLGYNGRCCSIDLNIAPKPLQLICAYAPSMVADPVDDLSRKEQFWHFFGETFDRPPPHKQWCFLGDWNVRLSTEQDPEEMAIGPDAWSKRQVVMDPERDNAEYFLEFLIAHDLFLPQTFDQPSLKHRITYKETTATGANFYRPTLADWAALDYVAIPKNVAPQVLKCRSNPFVSLATRHFPVELTLNTTPIPHRLYQSLKEKLNFDQSTGDYRTNLDIALQATLNLEPGCPIPAPFQIAIFTDGSCAHDNNPQAGWGFTVSHPVQMGVDPFHASTFDIDGFGPVELPRDIPASIPTNNLAEIQAVIEALDWPIGYKTGEDGHIHVYTDSDYVLGFLEGRNHPKANFPQVSSLLQYWYTATLMFDITAHKVPAHTGVPGNERADALASKGQTQLSLTGRFHSSPPYPLLSPEHSVPVPCEVWTSSSLDAKNVFFKSDSHTSSPKLLL